MHKTPASCDPIWARINLVPFHMIYKKREFETSSVVFAGLCVFDGLTAIDADNSREGQGRVFVEIPST
jgi:hypothetical protein